MAVDIDERVTVLERVVVEKAEMRCLPETRRRAERTSFMVYLFQTTAVVLRFLCFVGRMAGCWVGVGRADLADVRTVCKKGERSKRGRYPPGTRTPNFPHIHKGFVCISSFA